MLFTCCTVSAAANVYGPEAGNEEVYNCSGCREIVESVLGGCNGESINVAAAAAAAAGAKNEQQQSHKQGASETCRRRLTNLLDLTYDEAVLAAACICVAAGISSCKQLNRLLAALCLCGA
jgi:hypothetical protein